MSLTVKATILEEITFAEFIQREKLNLVLEQKHRHGYLAMIDNIYLRNNEPCSAIGLSFIDALDLLAEKIEGRAFGFISNKEKYTIAPLFRLRKFVTEPLTSTENHYCFDDLTIESKVKK